MTEKFRNICLSQDKKYIRKYAKNHPNIYKGYNKQFFIEIIKELMLDNQYDKVVYLDKKCNNYGINIDYYKICRDAYRELLFDHKFDQAVNAENYGKNKGLHIHTFCKRSETLYEILYRDACQKYDIVVMNFLLSTYPDDINSKFINEVNHNLYIQDKFEFIKQMLDIIDSSIVYEIFINAHKNNDFVTIDYILENYDYDTNKILNCLCKVGDFNMFKQIQKVHKKKFYYFGIFRKNKAVDKIIYDSKLLENACKGNNYQLVEYIIQHLHKKNINVDPSRGLVISYVNGNEDISDYLIENCDINKYAKNIIDELYRERYLGLDIDKRDLIKEFHDYYIRNGIDHYTNKLLKHLDYDYDDAEVKKLINYCIINNFEYDHKKYFKLLCKKGDLGSIKKMINVCQECRCIYDYEPYDISRENMDDKLTKYLIINFPEECIDNDDALKWAFGNDCTRAIKILSERFDKDIIFDKAYKKSNIKIMSWLLDSYPEIVNEKKINRLFRRVCTKKNLHTIKKYYQKYFVDKNIVPKIHSDSEYIFRYNCDKNNLDIVKWLNDIFLDIDIHVWDEYALCNACEYGYYDMVNYLLDRYHDIDIHVLNDKPFRFACKSGNLDIVKLLLNLAPDIDIMVSNPNAFECALIKGHLDVAKYLKTHYPDIDHTKYIKYPTKYNRDIKKWLEDGCPCDFNSRRIKSARK